MNPVFYQALDFEYEAFIPPTFLDSPKEIIKNFPPIILDLFDHDGGMVNAFKDKNKTGTYISRGSINLKDASCRYLECGTNNVLYESLLARPKVSNAEAE